MHGIHYKEREAPVPQQLGEVEDEEEERLSGDWKAISNIIPQFIIIQSGVGDRPNKRTTWPLGSVSLQKDTSTRVSSASGALDKKIRLDWCHYISKTTLRRRIVHLTRDLRCSSASSPIRRGLLSPLVALSPVEVNGEEKLPMIRGCAWCKQVSKCNHMIYLPAKTERIY